MMRMIFLAILLCTSSCCAAARNLHLLRPRLGDARMAGVTLCVHTNCSPPGLVSFNLPTGEYKEMTFCGWIRMVSPTGADFTRLNQTTSAFVCPEPLSLTGPDLLAGGGGFGVPGGITLSGAISFDVPLTGYAADLKQFPYGVYTVAGSATNIITVTVGGADVNVGPGEFNRNVVAGPADSIQISGVGVCAVGVSKCHLHRFANFMDGNLEFTLDSIVTNEIKFVSYRFRVAAGQMIYQSDMSLIDLSSQVGSSQSNQLAVGVSHMSSRGVYRLGITGLSIPVEPGVEMEMFDFRWLPWWLSDAELTRVHGNGAQEIGRRGILRWR